MKSIFKITVCYIFLFSQVLLSQPDWETGFILTDSVHSLKIKTCMLTPFESLTDFPLINMNSSERLLLQFDDFNFDSEDYMYSITHCNSDWSVSDLHFTEYIDGFPENYIQTFDFSFNTKVSYVHYELVLPNSDFRFIKSGNYVLTVYDTEQSDIPLFTKRFMVYDDKLFLGARVQQSTLAKGRYTDHEIDVTVNFGNIDYVNPINDVHLSIYQGHRWDNAITNLTPSFVERKRLVYDFEEESSFGAGNEYRFFDSKSVRFYTERVQEIIRDTVVVVVVVVVFVDKGDLYLYGALTDWHLKEEAKLNYDERMGCYETSLLLKQGYYNYTYLFIPEDTQLASQEAVDGHFHQTSQDYYIFVYLYDYDYGYDRLLGYRKISTRGMF